MANVMKRPLVAIGLSLLMLLSVLGISASTQHMAEEADAAETCWVSGYGTWRSGNSVRASATVGCPAANGQTWTIILRESGTNIAVASIWVPAGGSRTFTAVCWGTPTTGYINYTAIAYANVGVSFPYNIGNIWTNLNCY